MADAWTRPIRLNVVEEVMFWDDRPAYPWSFYIQLLFDGVIDRAIFEKAVGATLDRHVLMRSIVQQKGRRLYFVPKPDAFPQIYWLENEAIDPKLNSDHLDIRHEIGLRITVARSENQTEVILRIHHSSCDGLGAFKFIEELLIHYSNEQTRGKKIALASIDSKQIWKRGKWWGPLRDRLKTLKNQWIGLQGAKQFLQRNPVPLIPCTPEENDSRVPENYPRTFQHEFDRKTTQQIIKVTKSSGCTVNDWLAHKIFLGVHQWRQLQNETNVDDWIRMMVPVNLRNGNGAGQTVANIVSSVFLDRRGEHFSNTRELLSGIHDEMHLIKDKNLGLIFPLSLKLTRLMPGGLKKAARKDECSMSLIFTNPGRVFVESELPKDSEGRLVAGNLTLMQTQLVAPLRPYNLASFSSVCYAGRIMVTGHLDQAALNSHQIGQLEKSLITVLSSL